MGPQPLTGHGALLVHSLLRLPHQPPVSPAPKGDTSMATIIRLIGKNGQASYRTQVRRRVAPPLSATFTKRSDAHKWVQVTEAAILEGRHFKTAEAKRHTVADLIERYCREVLPRKAQ